MKKIIRLTESDLHNIIQRSVVRVLREQEDGSLLLQSIAQSITQKDLSSVEPGDNVLDIELEDGRAVFIDYNVICNPYLRKGMRSASYDVPDDPDEIVDNPEIEVENIIIYDDDDNEISLSDNGIIKKTLENNIQVDYRNYDVPSEKDFFFDDEPYRYE